MKLNELDQAFFKQIQEAAKISRSHTKLTLVRELIESNRIISVDSEQINQLGNQVSRLQNALRVICGGITEDILGKTSMSREDMQSVAESALRESDAQRPQNSGDAKQIRDFRRRAEIAESALLKILENPCTKVTGDIARAALANKDQ